MKFRMELVLNDPTARSGTIPLPVQLCPAQVCLACHLDVLAAINCQGQQEQEVALQLRTVWHLDSSLYSSNVLATGDSAVPGSPEDVGLDSDVLAEHSEAQEINVAVAAGRTRFEAGLPTSIRAFRVQPGV